MARRPKKDEISIEWEAEDGYVGGKRPQFTSLSVEDFTPDMSDDDIEMAIHDIVQEDFNQRVSPGISRDDMKAAVSAIREKLKAVDAAST